MTIHELVAREIGCPYCGELIDVVLDCSIEQQHYIEDCQVCCRPIEFHVSVDFEGDVSVTVAADYE